MSRFLLDECVSPKLVHMLWERGMDTVHVRDRGMLSAPDHVVWRHAQDEQRTLCTVNANDFRKLANGESGDHHGVLALAGGMNPIGQMDLTMAALNWVKSGTNTGAGFLNRYLEVAENGEIVFAEIHFGLC